ncbi:MAG: hypothetical protein ACXWHJ_02145 [Candidatus Aminicenantales bacterium]
MKKKKISKGGRLYMALAANSVRPLLDAIARLEDEAKSRIIDDTEFIPEMEGLSGDAYIDLVEEVYWEAMNKARAIWLDDHTVSRGEKEIRDQFEASR